MLLKANKKMLRHVKNGGFLIERRKQRRKNQKSKDGKNKNEK